MAVKKKKLRCIRILEGNTHPVWRLRCVDEAKILGAGRGRFEGTMCLWQADGSLLQQWLADPDLLSFIALSPCRRFVLTAGNASTGGLMMNDDGSFTDRPRQSGAVIRLRPLANFSQELASFESFKTFIWDLAYSPDDHTIAAGMWDGRAVLYNAKTAAVLRSLWVKRLREIDDSVCAVAFSPDSKTLATSSGTCPAMIRIWRCTDGALLNEVPAQDRRVGGLTYSPDGKCLVSCSHGTKHGEVIIWNTSDWSRRCKFTAHARVADDAAFSSCGRMFATCGQDKIVNVWSIDDGHLMAQTAAHDDIVFSVDFSPTGNELWTADGKVRAWAVDRLTQAR